MSKLRKQFIVIPIIVGLIFFIANTLYLNYFPWANGYKNGSGEWSGYMFAKMNHIPNADACNDDPDMLPHDKEFQSGCRAFFK